MQISEGCNPRFDSSVVNMHSSLYHTQPHLVFMEQGKKDEEPGYDDIGNTTPKLLTPPLLPPPPPPSPFRYKERFFPFPPYKQKELRVSE